MWKVIGSSRNIRAKCYEIAKLMEVGREKQKRDIVSMRKSKKVS